MYMALSVTTYTGEENNFSLFLIIKNTNYLRDSREANVLMKPAELISAWAAERP
jgi:hypothetical protein